MQWFFVRVELHGATWLDYLNLHANMAAEGFLRTVEVEDGAKYRLPSGEYCIAADPATADTVYSAAHRAASMTTASFDLRVTQSAGNRFQLRPVRANRRCRTLPDWAMA
jgi:hypothetical protein